MDSISLNNIINEAIRKELFPGAALGVVYKGKIYQKYYGRHTFCQWSRQVNEKSIFDLASLTKALGTALGIGVLVQQGKIDFKSELGIFFENCPREKARITLFQLLTHSSGFPPWLPFYRRCFHRGNDTKELLNYIFNSCLFFTPGSKALYSDVGFILLGFIIEKISGFCLLDFFKRYLFNPVGAFFITQKEIGLEERMLFMPTGYCPIRKKSIWGQTSDLNAWAAGGLLGHAGLFSNLPSITLFLKALMDVYKKKVHKHNWLFEVTLKEIFESVAGDGISSRWSLGFDRPSPVGSSCGRFFSANSIGHLGYTGTSFWIDLDNDMIVIFLSNRTFPFDKKSDLLKMKEVRIKVHNEVRRIFA